MITNAGLKLWIARSKTDPHGHGTPLLVATARDPELCATRAARVWLDRVGQSFGPLLRPVSGERVQRTGLQARAVSRIVERLAREAAVDGEYSSHSLRSGFATSAYVRGVSEHEIQLQGRWKDRRSLDRYIQLGALKDRRPLQLSDKE